MKNIILGVLFVSLTLSASAEKLFIVAKEQKFAEASAAAATVYFVRPATLGKAVKIWAFVDRTPMGVTKGKMYTFTKVEPGKHLFWAKAENVSALELTLEPGKTYYLKKQVKMGAMKARVKLTTIGKDEWETVVGKCKYSELTSEGKVRGAEIVTKNFQKAREKADKAEG